MPVYQSDTSVVLVVFIKNSSFFILFYVFFFFNLFDRYFLLCFDILFDY